MLLMCASYERALMTQEIVRSEDAQCNTEELNVFFLALSVNSFYLICFSFFLHQSKTAENRAKQQHAIKTENVSLRIVFRKMHH